MSFSLPTSKLRRLPFLFVNAIEINPPCNLVINIYWFDNQIFLACSIELWMHLASLENIRKSRLSPYEQLLRFF